MSRDDTRLHDDPAGCAPADLAPDDRPVFGDSADEDLAALAKALGHPVRVRIVRMLSAQQTCMYGDIADSLPIAQSTVSQHLKILKDAGLVRGTVSGPRVCYCIDPAGLRRLRLLTSAL